MSSRRSFLSLLSATALAPLIAFRDWRDRRLVLNEFTVAGVRHHAPPDRIARMRSGDRLEVIAEPENPHDPFAVALYHSGRRIGYLPRDQNHTVARLLAQDVHVHGILTRVAPNEVPWRAVRARLTMEG